MVGGRETFSYSQMSTVIQLLVGSNVPIRNNTIVYMRKSDEWENSAVTTTNYLCLLWLNLQIFINLYNIRFQTAISIQCWSLLTCLLSWNLKRLHISSYTTQSPLFLLCLSPFPMLLSTSFPPIIISFLVSQPVKI